MIIIEPRFAAHRQFIAFLLVGGGAACLNFLSRIFFSHWLNYATAIILAYIVGMLTAFIFNRLLVFRGASNPMHEQVMWFTIINILALAQTLAVSFAAARFFFPAIGMKWRPELLAHGLGVAVPVVTSYIGHKRFSFRNT